jgi:hypothetical protein
MHFTSVAEADEYARANGMRWFWQSDEAGVPAFRVVGWSGLGVPATVCVRGEVIVRPVTFVAEAALWAVAAGLNDLSVGVLVDFIQRNDPRWQRLLVQQALRGGAA